MAEPTPSFERLAKAPLDEVRQLLLRPTLEHAATHIPYYRDAWQGAWQQVHTVDELARLPLLEKADAIEHQAALTHPAAARYVGVISSGTSHGELRPLRVPRSEEERLALSAYLGATGARAPTVGGEPALVLEVRSMQHGLPEQQPPAHVLRIPWAFTANSFRLFRELVSQPLSDGRRVNGLIVGSGAIKPLTAWLIEAGVDLEALAVREIGTTGFALSTHWKRVIASRWGANVYDNFSLSEFSTSAQQCLACGYYHWGRPPLIQEVLDVFTGKPLASGVGVLVLTGLFPFVQAFPLIRYWTGDLVELGVDCPGQGRGFRCRGRVKQALLWEKQPEQPVLVTPMDIEDLLDGEPHVARDRHPVETLGLIRSVETGMPKFELSLHGSDPLVRFELRFDPEIFPSTAIELAERLAAALRERSPTLQRYEASGEGQLQLEPLGPGQLSRKWSKY